MAPERREVDRRQADQPASGPVSSVATAGTGGHRAESLAFVRSARLVLAHAGSLRGGLAGEEPTRSFATVTPGAAPN